MKILKVTHGGGFVFIDVLDEEQRSRRFRAEAAKLPIDEAGEGSRFYESVFATRPDLFVEVLNES